MAVKLASTCVENEVVYMSYKIAYVGAELTDFVMVLNTTAAVKTFMHHGSITLGGNISG